jgi:bacterioferritin (cytochrome b1)
MLTGTKIQLCQQLDIRMVTECQQSYRRVLNNYNAEFQHQTIELLIQFIRQIEDHHNRLTTGLNFIQKQGIVAFIKKDDGH